MNVLVVFDEGLNGIRSQLEGNLVPQHHVDVHNVRFNVEELVVEETFDQWVLILS